jgi:hypothetical protein
MVSMERVEERARERRLTFTGFSSAFFSFEAGRGLWSESESDVFEDALESLWPWSWELLWSSSGIMTSMHAKIRTPMKK